MPETIATILRSQPKFLSNHFHVDLVSSPHACVPDIIEHEKVEFHALPMKRGISFLSDIISVFRMLMLFIRLKPDVVHSYTPKAGLVAMLAARLAGVPVRIHTFTGLIFPSRQGLMQKILIAIDRLICFCATHIIPEGQGVRADLLAFEITNKPLNVIGFGNIAGVDTAYFDPNHSDVCVEAQLLKEKLQMSNDSFVFCFVGRLNRDKGVHELLMAFQALPDHIHLVLVGGIDETAPISDEDLTLITSHARIHYLGFQSDIRPMLKSAHVLVLPSYREGFPNVILQAGSMKLPVIATNINGCNEVIQPNVNGWLVPVKDIDALTEAMQLALHSSHLLQMGEEARQLIEQRFEQQTHWLRMQKFYHKISHSLMK